MTGSKPTERGPCGPFSAPAWDLGRRILEPRDRPLLMGVVNLTPDSFWAGSRPAGVAAAVDHALALVDQGADILDLGAESSRPGAEPIDVARECKRLLPVLIEIRRASEIPISVDTVRAETARAALTAGADAINDISGARDADMLPLVAEQGCGLILMHMQGTPRSMQQAPRYADVAGEVGAWLAEHGTRAESAGVATARLMVDPGIGFGKTLAHNLALLRNLPAIGGGRPLLLGASRKNFIHMIDAAETADRLPGSLAALTAAWAGGAAMVRVHDVAASRQFLAVLAALHAGDTPSGTSRYTPGNASDHA